MKRSVSALEYALTLLGRRDYCCQELGLKLEKRGYKKEEALEAIERLCHWGYLNDEAYVAIQIDRFLQAGRSRAYIRKRLLSSGVESRIIESGLEKRYSPEQEKEIIKVLWDKMVERAKFPPGEKEIYRWARRLYAAGFPPEEIRPYLIR